MAIDVLYIEDTWLIYVDRIIHPSEGQKRASL